MKRFVPVWAVAAIMSMSLAAPAGAQLICNQRLTLDRNSLPQTQLGASYSQTVKVSDGNGDYSWTLNPGTLPNGLSASFNREIATISGRVSEAGAFNVKGRVVDSAQNCKDIDLPLLVCSVVTTSSLLDSIVGANYSQTLAAPGAESPTWSIASGRLPDGLTLSSAGVISGRPTTAGTETFTVKFSDRNNCADTRQLSITICNNITIGPASLADATIGQNYGQTFTQSGGTGTTTFAMGGTVPGLTFDAARATLSGAPTSLGTFSFTISATDSLGCGPVKQYTLQVKCPAISIAPAALGGGAVGTAFSPQTFSATGGTAPYSFALSTGSLPPGLTLQSGALSGTPTTAGTFSFDIKASDANSCVATRSYSITICPRITLDPVTLPGGTVGVAYSQRISAGGGASPYTLRILTGNLPPGLTFNSGEISGTPTAETTSTFVVGAVDANNCPGSQSYTIVVKCPTLQIIPATAPNGTVGATYNATFTASGGTAPYTVSITGDAIPGLTASGGEISGRPAAAGSYSITVNAIDANRCTGSTRYTIVISAPSCPSITVGPASIPNATVGVNYKVAFSANGGASPHSFAHTGDTVPGLTFANGEVAGTPTTAGTYTFTITARDANGCLGGTKYTLVVGTPACPTIDVLPSSLPNGTVKIPYTATFSTRGGAAPIDFGLSAGALPPGLTLSGNTLSGTPTAAGTYRFTIKASDANRCTGAMDYSVVIAENTTCPTGTATPQSPAAGATFDGVDPIRFGWSAVSEATGYDVLVSSDGGATFASVASTTGESANTASARLPAGSYVWLVRTRFGSPCKPTDSATSRFSIVAQGNCPTATPTLIAPANGASDVTSPATFSWSAVPDAVGYRVLLAANGGSMTAVATTKATSVSLDVPSGTIDWTVEALFDRCPATIAKAFRFTTKVVTKCPTDPAALLAPADGASGLSSNVTFQWNAVTGASSYIVHASVDGGAFNAVGKTTSTQLSATLPQGRIQWHVETLFDGCASTISRSFSFTISGATNCTGLGVPTLTAPVSGAADVRSPVTFTWTAVPRAVSYQLFVSLNRSAFELAGSTTETSLTRIAPAGTLAWYVEAVFLGCSNGRSTTSQFTVIEAQACPTGTISLQAPQVDATLSSPVTFAWSEITGAASYRVWVSIDGASAAVIAKTTARTATADVPSGSVSWWVEAVFDHCPAIISARSLFTVRKATTCDSNVPATLVGPSGDTTSPVDFRWNAAPNTVGYRVWLSTAGAPFEDIGTVRDTHLPRELEPGSYSWFIESLFAACPSAVSAKLDFRIPDTTPRCTTEAPAVLSPVDGAASVASPVTLLWSSVPTAIAYRVFASLGTSFELIGTTKDTSITHPVPPGNISWYVEAVFKECPSTRSAVARFFVPPSQNCSQERPEIITPRDGTASLTSPVTFGWNPVNGGVKYIVIIHSENGSASPVGETIGTSLTANVPPGTSEWWVVAFRSGCTPAESAHAKFSIPVPQACDSRPPVLVAPADGAPNVISPVRFAWTAVRGAKAFKVWVIDSRGVPSLIATTSETTATASIPDGTLRWYVEATFDGCSPIESAKSSFTVVPPPPTCRTPDTPQIHVVGQVLSETQYSVRWTPVANASSYELQEATDTTFTNANTTLLPVPVATFRYRTETPIRKLYRVRAISSCNEDRGPFSDVVGLHIVPANTIETRTRGTAEIGVQQGLIQTLFIPGSDPPVSFQARTDRPWLHVSPESGILGPAGVTLTLTADPGSLFVGANTGTVLLTYGGAGAGKQTGHAVAPASKPVSITLVTPVVPGGKNTPPPDSLIIPAVAHAPGVNGSQFESDVRICNTSSQTMNYQINFTPSGTDGTVSGSSTTLQVEPGATTALDDVLASFFGTGTSGAAAGTLEIRPLTSTTSSAALSSNVSLASPTIASSRTYNVTANGTLGQYIPAIPFASFVGKSAGGQSILSLQQIAESPAYRTNLGLVEASGEPAEVMIRVFNPSNELIAEIPQSLRASEHKQINSILAANNIRLDDGRFEVEVTSDTGKVTAYASRIDNFTGDPLLVSPVVKSSAQGTRYVVPGIAYIDGITKWRSDMRVFNAASTSTNATITFYPQGNPGGAMSKDVTIAAGQVLALDNILSSFFGITDPSAGGSVLVSTKETSSIVATARTYAQGETGTYGLFIEGIRPDQAIGLGERSMHLLQLEQSAEFRTNVALVETTGQPVTAEVTLVLPDSKVTTKVPITLAGNGFTQFPLSSFGAGNSIYNARISIKVTSGTGRVSAYGSVVDNRTQDGTYVPAQ